MNESLPLDKASQVDRAMENRSGGVDLNSGKNTEIEGDVVGRDKIEQSTINLNFMVPEQKLHAAPGVGIARLRGLMPVVGLIVIMSLVGLTQLIGGQPAPVADDMVYIPAGSFTMGSDLDAAPSDAHPAHQVDLDAYWIDRDEVTNRAYQAFLEATEHRPPRSWNGKYPAGRDDLPVAGATWSDAVAYCSFVGKRLPTEAEWEKAARGTDQRVWPWGDEWVSTKANAAAAADGAPEPTGSYLMGASPYGVLDMAGNVWEWVQDWYGEGYYTLLNNHNPTGPALGEFKVARGGSWMDAPLQTRTFMRLGIYPPDFPSDVVGFRCACTDCRR